MPSRISCIIAHTPYLLPLGMLQAQRCRIYIALTIGLCVPSHRPHRLRKPPVNLLGFQYWHFDRLDRPVHLFYYRYDACHLPFAPE